MNRDEVIAAAEQAELPVYKRIDLVAVRGENAHLFDMNGDRYLDLYGSHAVALLGHSPSRVVEAIANQARELLFSTNLVHLPARARAARMLANLAPFPARVFFVNSGAEANETALKLARQATGRRDVVVFDGGFHGRTLGAAAACALGKYRDSAAGLVQDDAFRIAPFNDVAALESMLDENCAAAFVEPVQSMGGVRTLTAEFAHALRVRCDKVGAKLIFDEVQTAPARTGCWFAGSHWEVAPDLISTAKGLAAGFPASAVLAHEDIAAGVGPGDQGTTFGGGPVAAAAIAATLDTLLEIDGPARARAIEETVRGALNGVAGIVEVRGLGALLGVALDRPAAPVLAKWRDEHRVLAGGCPGDTNVIRLFPPLTIEPPDLEAGLGTLREVLA
ncbi:MAG: aminotransferase class III-fold pyridoxal phosphate-dependent enzyme [Planctomycetota bacterium]